MADNSAGMPPPPGTGLPDINRGPEILIVTGIMTAVAGLFTVVRFYVRWGMTKDLAWDDGLCLLSWVSVPLRTMCRSALTDRSWLVSCFKCSSLRRYDTEEVDTSHMYVNKVLVLIAATISYPQQELVRRLTMTPDRSTITRSDRIKAQLCHTAT